MLEDDFGASLMAELDTAFDEGPGETVERSTPKRPDVAAATVSPTSSAPQSSTPASQREPVSNRETASQDTSLLSMEEAIKNGVLPPDFFSEGQE